MSRFRFSPSDSDPETFLSIPPFAGQAARPDYPSRRPASVGGRASSILSSGGSAGHSLKSSLPALRALLWLGRRVTIITSYDSRPLTTAHYCAFCVLGQALKTINPTAYDIHKNRCGITIRPLRTVRSLQRGRVELQRAVARQAAAPKLGWRGTADRVAPEGGSHFAMRLGGVWAAGILYLASRVHLFRNGAVSRTP